MEVRLLVMTEKKSLQATPNKNTSAEPKLCPSKLHGIMLEMSRSCPAEAKHTRTEIFTSQLARHSCGFVPDQR